MRPTEGDSHRLTIDPLHVPLGPGQPSAQGTLSPDSSAVRAHVTSQQEQLPSGGSQVNDLLHYPYGDSESDHAFLPRRTTKKRSSLLLEAQYKKVVSSRASSPPRNIDFNGTPRDAKATDNVDDITCFQYIIGEDDMPEKSGGDKKDGDCRTQPKTSLSPSSPSQPFDGVAALGHHIGGSKGFVVDKQANAGTSVPFRRSNSSDDETYAVSDDITKDTGGYPIRVLRCKTISDLDDDTVSFMAYWQSLRSPALLNAVMFALRGTFIAVLPTFCLVYHPSTEGFFTAGALIPTIAALLMQETLGLQVIFTFMGIQAVALFMTWGVIMNTLGAVHNTAAWWCAVVFGPMVLALLGDVRSKRMMMMYTVIMMQTEHMPGGTELVFPCFFARDFIFALLFSMLAVLLPYPVLAARRADETLKLMWNLLGVSVVIATKSQWAPVNIDAKSSLAQIPFLKMAALADVFQQLLVHAGYEPLEKRRDLYLRSQRLNVISRVKVHLYTMAAAATKHVEDKVRLHRSSVLKELERCLRSPAQELSLVLKDAFEAIGAVLSPEETVAAVDYSLIYEKAKRLADEMERVRVSMIYTKDITPDETNQVLYTLIFHHGLLDIVGEIQTFEAAMRNFDESKILSLPRCAWEFFLENWRDFWEELPKRLTLATPRDVRLWKDAIKYSLAYAVACAFTLNFDHNEVYFFGMAILIRLAQQTAAETLTIGVARICGLAIGAALAYIAKTKTNDFLQQTVLMMIGVFLSLTFTRHPLYGSVAQYMIVVALSGLRLAQSPGLLLGRLADNVFAFVSYFAICTFVFPTDPIRVLWNTRIKILLNVSDLTQQFAVIGCAPLTQSGQEGGPLLEEAAKLMQNQRELRRKYSDWLPKIRGEPTIRGNDLPMEACTRLQRLFAELSSVEEVLLMALTRLHAPRAEPPIPVLLDLMEAIHPFIIDTAKITRGVMQEMIDATEKPKTWTMQSLLHYLWKADCAVRGIQAFTGKVQRNFLAALQELGPSERQHVNQYVNSSFVNARMLANNTFDSPSCNEDDDVWKRVQAMSFRISGQQVLPREDGQIFTAIIIVFALQLHTLGQLLPPMTAIHEYEKSRVT
ncbi:hypothetical protein DQ04_09021010 [Trypanosoma grayi]|uniref:hypothetical protein n=1 Tax=Trypanosoma grayi TaxID=71804 RepID=UPI0004F427D6|nr:hypothetical protein DQ04_09021010 [Trypanosoma grayi]KEG07710.1 hypothetical protein DQ04_09021010 [Trypanosoma grayi]